MLSPGRACRSCRLPVRAALSSTRSQSLSYATARPHPPRCAIIGSGPAGFYAAHRMLQKLPGIRIDMYEALPTPFGLVRYGIAPDHPEVKNCIQTFDQVAENPNFTFVGNVPLGDGCGRLPLSAIRPHYDALFFAYGASRDRQLGIAGEGLDGIYSARAFVGWYNGLPEYARLDPKLDSAECVAIIGQGNVALDVARILLSPLSRLRQTDISEVALESLSRSHVREVNIVGRRGPLQAPYTTKEVRELTQLPGVSFRSVDNNDAFMERSDKLPRVLKRLAQILSQPSSCDRSSADKYCRMQYMLSPSGFSPSASNPQTVGSVTFDNMVYTHDPKKVSITDQDSIRNMRVSRAADKTQTTLRADAVFRSIGYKAEPISGLDDIGVPFDVQSGIIPNDVHGRVLTPARGPGELSAGHVPGVYCAGWVKRGPTGVIATTMVDAFTSADVLIADWLGGVPFGGNRGANLGWDAVRNEVEKRGIRSVNWADWRVIDAEERRRGLEKGRERVKCASVAEMLSILDKGFVK